MKNLFARQAAIASVVLGTLVWVWVALSEGFQSQMDAVVALPFWWVAIFLVTWLVGKVLTEIIAPEKRQ